MINAIATAPVALIRFLRIDKFFKFDRLSE
jgi:hypothetical protein